MLTFRSGGSSCCCCGLFFFLFLEWVSPKIRIKSMDDSDLLLCAKDLGITREVSIP